ncbi:hypothetical protein MWH28_09925 [Natroniella sulfidigena]|uniref:hypothetical protein n=1 Tax=Natroniella sulfidigena TaxID=723921 RepID=UPI00200A4818|nr:hypothetical protein [Natroniella sulfidigena]MCK8817676.1 hypothetical protein [Natroniella sulfidigena]
MADCEHITNCAFFNDKMDEKAGLASLYKKRYCQGDNSNCARYLVSKTVGSQCLPSGLFPNQHQKAEKIIKECN